MNDKYQPIIEQFLKQVKEIDKHSELSMPRVNEGVYLCNDALYRLKRSMEEFGFENRKEEIVFFKKVKVLPLSYLVYFSEVRNCELLMPKVGAKYQLAFLNKTVRRINKFFQKHADFANYMEQDMQYLDQQYFTREHQVFPLYALPESCYLDPKFFTSHDMLWARIEGMKRLVRYVKKRMNGYHNPVNGTGKATRKREVLEWTASKAALTELIYALHSSKAINYGEKDIKSITSAFENLFGVELDNVYKTYSEIKARKGLRARFLENLTYQFKAKMEIDDEF
ncbi:RteC domain-containing protein [Galbibacter mesophilus]|uniref:RteC domain-containing protein n=1 Tax=Galbibacter mesophilus TaxID=379069 RepID=UPI00191D7B34|nr:RteC domain-containing protein [Galbibacter mesophilus]MCM5663651.1 RteC domain-containing protein [Galbibacter mesophilus]